MLYDNSILGNDHTNLAFTLPNSVTCLGSHAALLIFSWFMYQLHVHMCIGCWDLMLVFLL